LNPQIIGLKFDIVWKHVLGGNERAIIMRAWKHWNIGFVNFSKVHAIETGLLENQSPSKSNESAGGIGLS
jgi:hypothetical protein